MIGAGHDRVPAETERDSLPNCQRTFPLTTTLNEDPIEWKLKCSRPTAEVNAPANAPCFSAFRALYSSRLCVAVAVYHAHIGLFIPLFFSVQQDWHLEPVPFSLHRH